MMGIMNLPYPYQSLKVAFESDLHWFVHCVFHKDDNASMCINKKTFGKMIYQEYLYFKCFGCGEHGDAKSFARKYLQHDSKSISLNLQGWKAAEKYFPQPAINWETKKGCSLEHVPAEEKKFADYIGVSVETIRKFGIGWKDDKFLIPMYDENGICGIQVRDLEGDKRHRYRCRKGSKHGWFKPNISYKWENLFICEGWSDTAVLIELGFLAIGRFNAACISNPIIRGDAWNKYIIADNDEAGIKGATKLQEKIGGKIIVPLYDTFDGYRETYKDIRELYLKKGKEKTKLWLEEQL